jgi:AbrB family looped-hinge helix DNA binding protein
VSKVTSKYQVSIPKALAERIGVRPGDDLEWEAVGGELRVKPAHRANGLPTEERLRIFREAMKRIDGRKEKAPPNPGRSRGWTREDLYYDRGRTR